MYTNRFATTALVALSSLLVAPAAHANWEVCYEAQEVNVPGYDGLDRPTTWTGVNDDGHVVGSYCIYEGCQPYAVAGAIYHFRAGTFEKFAVPGYDLTLPGKMNDNGDIALQACNLMSEDPEDLTCQAFLRDRRGRYLPLAAPDSPRVAAVSVNENGVIGGYWWDEEWGYRGVVWDEDNFSVFDAWRGRETYVGEVLDDGTMVGTVVLDATSMGFWMDDEGVSYLRYPAHKSMWVNGANDRGWYVGRERALGKDLAYLYKAGEYTRVRIDGAHDSAALDINDYGVIVGTYDEGSRGFIARPEPCIRLPE